MTSIPRESAWHHRAKNKRAEARALLQAWAGKPSAKLLQRVRKAEYLLDHHGSSVPEMGWPKQRGADKLQRYINALQKKLADFGAVDQGKGAGKGKSKNPKPKVA